MTRVYPSRSFGVVNETNAFRTTRGITNDSSKTLATAWTDQVSSRVATGPSSSSYPTFNLVGPDLLKQGWRFDGIANVLQLDSGFLSEFVSLGGITYMQKIRPSAYASSSAETYIFFLSDGGTSNASVGRFAVGFSGNSAANQITITGRRVDGGTRFVDYVGTSGNTGSFWTTGEEFILTVTVDYTGKSFGDGSKCVWSVWKNDQLIYRQNVSSFNSGSINTTTAPANIGASTTPFGGSIGGSLINSKYGKAVIGDTFLWPSLLSDSEIISKVGTLKVESQIKTIQITSPTHHQAFQKNGSNQQDIAITGTYIGSPTSITASFNGGTPQVIVASPSGGTFSGTLTAQNAGQGDLKVWFTNDSTNYCIRKRVAVTDIYALIGQSNNTDRTDTNFSLATPKTYAMASGMGPCIFNSRYYFAQWTDGYLCQNYPVQFAQDYFNKNGYPCAFIYAAIGGTNISKWQPGSSNLYTPAGTDGDQFGAGSNLYTRAKNMVNTAAPAGIRAFLWHQGEADAGGSVDAATELSQLQGIATQLNTDFPGIPMLVAKLQIIRTTSNVVIDASAVRTGQVNSWGSMSNIVAGPDLSDLECDFQSAFGYFHLLNDTVMSKVADRWFNSVVAAGLV